MDVNKLTPLQVIVIFGLFMGMLIFWLWADSRALDYMGPVHMHTDRNGSLFIQIDNHLVEHDASGKFVSDHDLAALGIEKFHGDFAFFNNGDILLAKRQHLPTINENLSTYKRETNQRPVDSGKPGDGLFRCSLNTQTCERFGEQSLDFGRAFHLFITPDDESVYVADSSRHSLRKYSHDGTELGSRDSSFIFPNQILIHDGKLYVTNTNNHSIHIVKPDTDNFAQSVEMHNIIHPEARKNGKIWPSSLLKVGTHWWVNNMDSGMSFGSIDIYDENWKFSKSLKLPEEADPVSVIQFNGIILISDFSLHRIYQFDQNGVALADFRSPEMDQILAKQIEQQQFYKRIQSGALFAFSLSVIAGLFFGFKSVWHTPDISQPASARTQLVDFENPEIHWLKPDGKFQKTKRTVFLLAVITTPFVIIIVAGLLAIKGL